MQNFHEDIDTRITFHQLQNDGTQIECNVHTKKGKLFFDRQGELYEPDLLPTIYLVDNRTNCHGLVLEDVENITVKVRPDDLARAGQAANILSYFSTSEPSEVPGLSLPT